MAKDKDGEYVPNTKPTMGVLEISAKLIDEPIHDPEVTLYQEYRSKQLKEYTKDAKAILFVNVASASRLSDVNYKQLVQMYKYYSDKGL